MELIQKIEFAIVMFLLVFNIALVVSNSELFFGFLHDNEISAPHDFIPEDKILAYPDKIVIEIEDYGFTSYAPTGSMLPVLDYGANGITIKPESEEDLHVGDIVNFWANDELIAHRIIEKGVDDDGTYFITKGDNNTISDGKVRFEQIDSVLVALIY